jgi:hypothetical protein
MTAIKEDPPLYPEPPVPNPFVNDDGRPMVRAMLDYAADMLVLNPGAGAYRQAMARHWLHAYDRVTK